MQLGIVGLGKMGANMALRLLRGGHYVVGFNRNPERAAPLVASGLVQATSLEDLVSRLESPRIVWLMLPCGDPVDQAILQLLQKLSRGDIIVDGGNSYYKHTLHRAELVEHYGIHFVDVGTSGGIWGLENGYCLTVGGDAVDVERLRPIFQTLAPAADKGWGHVGPHGAGHFVKMVHNGIEYGLMQAYAEGFHVLEAKRQFDLDLDQVARIWQHGSVVRSWLLDLTADVLDANPSLHGIAPYVADSGEGRWTVVEAVDLDVPAPVMTLGLQARLRSRDRNSYADRLLSAMRNRFGGHEIKRPDED